MVALNKIDVPDGRDLVDLVRADIEARGWSVYPVSAASHEGLRELTFAMASMVAGRRAMAPARAAAPRIVLRPGSGAKGEDFSVTEIAESDGTRAWRVRGEKPERWVRQTDFSNDEAVGFLADRLNRLGVEDRLLGMGAVEGDPVLIGHPDNAVVFDFRPGVDAGAENLSRRGEDARFDEPRPASRRRRAIDEAMPDRGEFETRADVARRLDHPDQPGRPDQPDESDEDES